MEAYNKGKKSKIPYTMMRGASNWSHKPLKLISPGVWGYMPLEPDHIDGYAQVSPGVWGYMCELGV